MNNRITFLHYLYNDADLGEVSSAKQFDINKIIGPTPKEREKMLEFFYIKYANKIPKEPNVKKKQTFSFSRA